MRRKNPDKPNTPHNPPEPKPYYGSQYAPSTKRLFEVAGQFAGWQMALRCNNPARNSAFSESTWTALCEMDRLYPRLGECSTRLFYVFSEAFEKGYKSRQLPKLDMQDWVDRDLAEEIEDWLLKLREPKD
jgi:hypothetical protein